MLATSSNLNICFNFFQGLTFYRQLQPSAHTHTLIYKLLCCRFQSIALIQLKIVVLLAWKSVEKKTIKCALKLEQIVSESLHKIFMNIISHLVCPYFSSSFEAARERVKWSECDQIFVVAVVEWRLQSSGVHVKRVEGDVLINLNRISMRLDVVRIIWPKFCRSVIFFAPRGNGFHKKNHSECYMKIMRMLESKCAQCIEFSVKWMRDTVWNIGVDVFIDFSLILRRICLRYFVVME